MTWLALPAGVAVVAVVVIDVVLTTMPPSRRGPVSFATRQSFLDALADTYGYRPPRLLDA